MKYFLEPFTFFLIAFLIISCQKNELPNTEDSLTQKAKSWYEQSHNPKMDQNPAFSGEPDWNNYFQIEDDIYFPLTSSIEKKNKSQHKLLNSSKKTFIKPYLILKEKEKKGFEESLRIFVSSDQSNFETIDKIIEQPSFTYVYSRTSNSKSIEYYSANKKEVISKNFFTGANNLTPTKSNNCVTWYIVKIDEYSNGYVEYTIIDSYDACDDSNGGSGGGNGGGGDNDGPGRPDGDAFDELLFPLPDCKSFEFANVFGQNVAATTNILGSFFVDHSVPGGVIQREVYTHIEIASFTAPSWMSPGIAANNTAGAIASANIETQAWFMRNTNAHPDRVKIQWEIELKNAMREMGGSIEIGENVYDIRSPAPYLIAFGATDCSR